MALRFSPERRIRFALSFFMAALVVSGLTAIPLKFEIVLIERFFYGPGAFLVSMVPGLGEWIERVAHAIRTTLHDFPFLAYGTDWLAFGHIGLAVMFIGPLRDPVKNIWVIEAGMVVCVLLIPWALVFGPLRGIPFFWTLVDMSFGVFGLVPLYIARKAALELAAEGE